MSEIVMTRVDARLIHGQVAVRWTKVLQAGKIVVIDNKSAADEFLVELLLLAAPSGVKVVVYSEEQALQAWKEDQFGNLRTIIIFQNIDSAKRCLDAGIGFQSINIGQVPKNPSRTYHANNTCHISEDELCKLESMADSGVHVYFHPTPEDKLNEFSAIRTKLRG